MSQPHEVPHQLHSEMHSQGLKRRSDLHIKRKLWHFTGVCMMALIYNYGGTKVSWTITLIACLVIIPLDVLRQRRAGLNRATMRIFGAVMRRHESHSLSGMTYLYLGAAWLLLLDHQHVVTLTLLFLAIGDPIASFFGLRFGRDRILGSKTLQGTIAAFVACSFVATAYYYFNNLMIERLLIIAPLSGLIGALSELLPVGKLDDNLTFPVICSSLLWILFYIYGG